MTNKTRYIAISATVVVVLAIVLGIQYWRSTAGRGSGVALIGGPFELVDQNGNPRRDTDFRGRYTLIYFGYSFCPDVCTTALNEMSQALDRLGAAADKIQPIFITIDPARDTPEQLKSYAANFHPRLVALTGSDEAIAGAAKAFRVYYAKSKETAGQQDYLMDHSSIIFLMDRDGRYLTHFTHATPIDAIVNGIRKQTS
jgi:protein SCO1/2